LQNLQPDRHPSASQVVNESNIVLPTTTKKHKVTQRFSIYGPFSRCGAVCTDIKGAPGCGAARLSQGIQKSSEI
jgi:hypothetical protein